MMQISVRGKSFQVKQGKWDSHWQQVQRQEWEPETFEIFDRYTDAKHSYIDGGAWIGATVLYGCQTARVVYAFEPDPVAFAELATNVKLNQPRLANIQLFQQAIAPCNGAIKLGAPIDAGDSASTMLTRPVTQAWIVQAIRFDKFARREKITDCNFIKMDIEGGEYQVIPAMAQWLAEFQPTLYLSLHPLQLYWSGLRVLRVLPILRTRLVERATEKLLNALAFYRYCYSAHGSILTRAEILANARRRQNSAIVFTNAW